MTDRTIGRVVVAGAGGLGGEVVSTLRLLEACGQAEFVGWLDDHPPRSSDAPHLGPIASEAVPPKCSVIIAVGDPVTRQQLWTRLSGSNVEFATIVHPSAVVSSGVVVGRGTYVAPFVFLAPGVVVGQNAVFTQYSSAGHDATVYDHAVMSPYSSLNGFGVVETGAFMATGSVVTAGVTIGAWSKVSAGCVVKTSCSPGSLVAGNPPVARVMFRPPDSAGS